MANIVFNVAKGRAVEFYREIKENILPNSAFVIVLLRAVEVDADLKRHAHLDALFTAVGNTQANFTNYARIILTDAELAALPAPDNVNDVYKIDLPDQSYVNAGGAVNNNIVKALVCFDEDTTTGGDTNIIPITAHDWVISTDGNTINLEIPNDFFEAQ